jgi:hypothetical protein
MPLESNRTREHLKSFDFRALFIEEMGWDRLAQTLIVLVENTNFQLHAVAQKRGLVAFVCDPLADGRIPDYATRRKIETQVAKSIHEHIIVYADRNNTAQVWQWVRREPGKPSACRERAYHTGQSGDPLIQRLQAIAFSLEEEESLTIIDVTGRVRAAFDVERITKRFYDRFKTEHAAFLKFIKGIPDEEMQRWYASVMINRLMFIYFIQWKGFLDNKTEYLRLKLAETKKRGKNLFYSEFLCVLFFKGFAEKDRSAETKHLLGDVPYLNGGLFLRHQIEELHGKKIDMADAAFEKLFDFFDAYQWHLDERPLRDDREINPDVLGYIFEKYINQKQMGAYYTREDITEYIGKNTIIPFLLHETRQKCKVAFEGEASVWRLLQVDPDRYIYDALKRGVALTLPPEIAAGVNDTSRRTDWNKPALAEYALPTEIWREVIARRRRYEEVRSKLAAGQVRDINDLIAFNLDIRQFAQDVITNSEGPDLLRAVWHAIVGRIPERSNERFENGISILDPTCGSGAFLFAALNILEPLYDACLDRMQVFVDDLKRSAEEHDPRKFSDFRRVLERANQHPNHRYFVLKSIIINNLFGVDIMEEAVEICKLRLFLKLVAQTERGEQIEPLPDIDFNIRTGNTLVGYGTYDDVKRAVTSKLDFDNAMTRIDEKATAIDVLFNQFRQQQTVLGGEVTPVDKQELRNRLKALEDELNAYLASEYGIDPNRKTSFENWVRSHKPFHWFIEFHGIMTNDGFDVIIGNPPYVVYSESKVDYRLEPLNYQTLPTKNLYAFVFERSLNLGSDNALVSLIVQLTVLSSERLPALQDLLATRGLVVAVSFPRRPESVFDGVEMPVAILLSIPMATNGFVTSRVRRFYTEERGGAMYNFDLTAHSIRIDGCRIAKIGSRLEQSIYAKLVSTTDLLGSLTSNNGGRELYYQEACRYWVKAMPGLPFFRRNGRDVEPPHGRTLFLRDGSAVAFANCLLNSSLFYWYYSTFSDCEHLNDGLVRRLCLPLNWERTDWKALSIRLMKSLTRHATRKTIVTKQGHRIEYDEIKALNSKTEIDVIDRVLAQHYGFTDEELDFIINYDIKYRMGRDLDVEDE